MAKKTEADFVKECELLLEQRGITPVPKQLFRGFSYMYKWQCIHDGEVWDATIKTVQTGCGCPKCGGKAQRISNITPLDEFLTSLSERNTQYDPVSYVSGYNGLSWPKCLFKCDTCDHEWTNKPSAILSGIGCPKCHVKSRKSGHTYTLEETEYHINQRNLRLPDKRVYMIGSTFTGYSNRATFKCDHGHQWDARLNDIVNRDAGCPVCANNLFSNKSIRWLEMVERHHGTTIQRATNGGEFCIPGTKYKVDGYDPTTNTVYEFHGNFWHGNPRIHRPEEINSVTGTTFGELHENTIMREVSIRNLGYTLTTIWEDEFDMLTNNEFISQITNTIKLNGMTVTYCGNDKIVAETHDMTMHIINIDCIPTRDDRRSAYRLITDRTDDRQVIVVFSDEIKRDPRVMQRKIDHMSGNNKGIKLHARQCTVRENDADTRKRFLDTHHIQGNNKPTVSLGAYFNDTLVGVMTFNPPKSYSGAKGGDDSHVGTWELSRFCVHGGYRVSGLASKILTFFKNGWEWSRIYSLADLRWGDGNLYRQMGFQLEATNPPDYDYVINGERKHRWNYRKDLLKTNLPCYDDTLTEYENMQRAGYWRVWDAGTLRFAITK